MVLSATEFRNIDDEEGFAMVPHAQRLHDIVVMIRNSSPLSSSIQTPDF